MTAFPSERCSIENVLLYRVACQVKPLQAVLMRSQRRTHGMSWFWSDLSHSFSCLVINNSEQGRT